MERVQISKIHNRGYIQIGEESILYGGFAQIYEDFCSKILFFSCTFSGDRKVKGFKNRNKARQHLSKHDRDTNAAINIKKFSLQD